MSKDLELLKRVKILLECMPMEPLQRQADTIIEEIREILAESESEPDSAYREASSLALSLHKKFYAEESPNFELCDSTAGIITQIDNMTCGLMKITDEHEPIAWQYRTTPNWIEKWSTWENCSKNAYEDYKRVFLLHDWVYETRELYALPPKREPLCDDEIVAIIQSNIANGLHDLARAIEKAHGIV